MADLGLFGPFGTPFGGPNEAQMGPSGDPLLGSIRRNGGTFGPRRGPRGGVDLGVKLGPFWAFWGSI